VGPDEDGKKSGMAITGTQNLRFFLRSFFKSRREPKKNAQRAEGIVELVKDMISYRIDLE